MGSAILAFASDEIDKIPDESFDAEVLNEINTALSKGDMKMSKTSRSRMLKKVNYLVIRRVFLLINNN